MIKSLMKSVELLTPDNLNLMEQEHNLKSEMTSTESLTEPQTISLKPSNPNKILFLDIDGPMIPTRAFYLENQGKLMGFGVADTFDPIAVGMLNDVFKETRCQLVISSTWRIKGLEICKELLTKNKVVYNTIHPDWETPRKMSSNRGEEIKMWLNKHKEVIKYAILDDEKVDLPNLVRVSNEDGMQLRHHLKLIELLT